MTTPELLTTSFAEDYRQDEVYFDDFHWVPGRGLYRNKELVPLPPKEQATLELLIGLRGQVASHRLIEHTVWPRQVVSYASLARCIYSLRQHLSQNGSNIIETVPRRGYRLAVAFRECGEAAASSRRKSIDVNPLAYSHYLAGIQQANNGSAKSLARAINYFEAALESDFQYTSAHAAICDVVIYQVLRGHIAPEDGFEKGIAAASQALEIDPLFVPAMSAQAWLQGLIGGDLAGGFKTLEKAEQHDPEYAKLYVHLSWLLRACGDMGAAVSAAEIAVNIDPHQLLTRHARTMSLFLAGQTEKALSIERRLCEEFPEDDAAQGYRAIFSATLGLHEEATASADRALALLPKDPILQAVKAYTLAKSGKHEDAHSLVQQVESCTNFHCPAVWVASVHVALGDQDAAMKALASGKNSHCPWTAAARFDPRLRPLEENGILKALYAQ